MEVEERAFAIIAEMSGFPVETIDVARALGQRARPTKHDPLAQFSPLGLDSLDLVQLALALEEEFGIELPDNEVDHPSLASVGGLIEHVQAKVDAKPKTYGEAQRMRNAAMRRHLDSFATTPLKEVDAEAPDIVSFVAYAGEIPTPEQTGNWQPPGVLDLTASMATTGPTQASDFSGDALVVDALAYATTTNVGAIDPRPLEQIGDKVQLSGTSLSMLVAQAEAGARHHARRIFEAGYYAGIAEDGLPDPAPSWGTFAEREGLRP